MPYRASRTRSAGPYRPQVAAADSPSGPAPPRDGPDRRSASSRTPQDRRAQPASHRMTTTLSAPGPDDPACPGWRWHEHLCARHRRQSANLVECSPPFPTSLTQRPSSRWRTGVAPNDPATPLQGLPGDGYSSGSSGFSSFFLERTQRSSRLTYQVPSGRVLVLSWGGSRCIPLFSRPSRSVSRLNAFLSSLRMNDPRYSPAA